MTAASRLGLRIQFFASQSFVRQHKIGLNHFL